MSIEFQKNIIESISTYVNNNSKINKKELLKIIRTIFDENKDLDFLVEYNGKQHYELIEFFGIDAFERTKISDQIKHDYCKNNNIDIFTIEYISEYIKIKNNYTCITISNHNLLDNIISLYSEIYNKSNDPIKFTIF